MNNDTQLDSFETALLAELRREVAEHPSPATTPVAVRRPRRRRLAAGATVVAASVVAVFGLGSFGGSPAFAVDQNSAGDVTVTVHRLDDAAGLEKALRGQGIDADVSYDADGFDATFGIDSGGHSSGAESPAGPPGGNAGVQGNVDSQGASGQADAGQDAGVTGNDPCGLGADPATLTQEGSDWVLRIPADSPLRHRQIQIGTAASGALAVQYAGDVAGLACGMVTMTGGTPGS